MWFWYPVTGNTRNSAGAVFFAGLSAGVRGRGLQSNYVVVRWHKKKKGKTKRRKKRKKNAGKIEDGI